MSMLTTEFYRLDPLTGCHNFISFVETVNQLSAQEENPKFSIMYTDMNRLHMMNVTRGHVYGDSVIRWLGIVLQEECRVPIYRIGGDDFAVILPLSRQAEYKDMLNRIFDRLNREGEQLGIPAPAASIALIHYDDGGRYSFNDVMFQLGETMLDLKVNKGRKINICQAQDLLKSTAKAEEQSREDINRTWELLRAIANDAISRIILTAKAAEATRKASYFDSISGLPNLSAALFKMEKVSEAAAVSGRPFSILLIDGDNLRSYNSISYAAGDEAIQNMGTVLSQNLRPEDFLARWRTGDEFMVILPDTAGEGARTVGERFCSAIRGASKNWKFPTSISIGIASYPKHGDNVNALVDAAEAANKRAKDEGKDQVILAE